MRQPLLAVAAVALITACGGQAQKGEIWYRAFAPEGGTPTKQQLESTSTKLNLRLGKAGIERREVIAVPPDRLRVVLPEAAVPRLAELYTALEEPGLPVTLKRIPD